MRKIVKYIIVFILSFSIIGTWLLFSSSTLFSEKEQFIYIYDGKETKEQFVNQLNEQHLISRQPLFLLIANEIGLWKKLQPGKFQIHNGQSLISIIRMLRNNHQSPVNFVINKLRTKEDLAKLIGKNFAADSLTAIKYLSDNDSLKKFAIDTNSLFTIIIPDTYQFKWNSSITNILQRLKNASIDFWNKNQRKQKAEELGLTKDQLYVLASITEEETNKNEEKGTIANVYLNRLRKNMYLGADPTIKFAWKDFSLKRILFVHLKIASQFNTYRYKGLPPGPICTPSIATMDAVLNQHKSNNLYFVADSSLNGYHHFSTSYNEHLNYAKAYQRALDKWLDKKQNQ